MQCNECGRQLTRLPFILDDSEIADMQLAVDKMNTAQTALKAEVYAGYRFEQDKDIYAYFKAVFDEMAEGRFLYAIWERRIRSRHDYPEGELLVINGGCFFHEDA
jgi:hypothetical protein